MHSDAGVEGLRHQQVRTQRMQQAAAERQAAAQAKMAQANVLARRAKTAKRKATKAVNKSNALQKKNRELVKKMKTSRLPQLHKTVATQTSRRAAAAASTSSVLSTLSPGNSTSSMGAVGSSQSMLSILRQSAEIPRSVTPTTATAMAASMFFSSFGMSSATAPSSPAAQRLHVSPQPVGITSKIRPWSSNGKRSTRYPTEVKALCIEGIVDGEMGSKRIFPFIRNVLDVFVPGAFPAGQYPEPHPRSVRRWTTALHHVVRVANGKMLSKMTHMVLGRDGGTKGGVTLTTAFLYGNGGKITFAPWAQPSKSAEDTHEGFMRELRATLDAYNDHVKSCKRACSDVAEELPAPRSLASTLMEVKVSMSDHAANEGAAFRLLVDEKRKLAEGFVENWAQMTEPQKAAYVKIIHTKCCDHKRNLICDEAVKEETKVLVGLIGNLKEHWEIGDSGLVDFVLLQLHHEFGLCCCRVLLRRAQQHDA